MTARVTIIDGKKKRCPKCGEVKLLSDFYKSKHTSSGRTCYCKSCERKDGQQYYLNHKEQRYTSTKKWRLSNVERWRELVRKGHSNRKEKASKYSKEYRLKKGDELREYNRLWSSTHKEHNQARQRKKNAIKANAPGSGISVEQSISIKQETGNHCVYCGVKSNNLQIDHVIPLSRGGADDITNAVTACPRCNVSKGNKTLILWLYQQRNCYD